MAYRLWSLPLCLFWILHALIHGFKHGLPGYARLRLSGYAGDGANRVWVHAASVGEVRAVKPLVEALIQQGEKILFTSFTATGYQAIRHDFADSVSSGVIPIDDCWHCRKFFQRHKIKLGLVVETELWPELLYQARKRGISLLLINARLSHKSLDAGRFVTALLSKTLGYFTQILTRNRNDLEALCSLGATENKITIIGNLKTRSETSTLPARIIEREYLILASSHHAEEQQFLQARPAGLEDYLLVIAPRHPDRSAAIQTEIERLGMNCSVRSKSEAVDQNTEVYLADTLGELKAFMAHARVVIMGGSFDTTGGHNLIEPAGLGCTIITGPSDSNIVEDIRLLGINSGVLQVENMAACWQAIIRLLSNPEEAGALAREARSRLAQQPDIIEQYMAAIKPYL